MIQLLLSKFALKVFESGFLCVRVCVCVCVSHSDLLEKYCEFREILTILTIIC